MCGGGISLRRDESPSILFSLSFSALFRSTRCSVNCAEKWWVRRYNLWYTLGWEIGETQGLLSLYVTAQIRQMSHGKVSNTEYCLIMTYKTRNHVDKECITCKLYMNRFIDDCNAAQCYFYFILFFFTKRCSHFIWIFPRTIYYS